MSRALIFDCDGVLADTERHGHLPAFNATFEHFGLPVRWSEDDYAKVLRIGGGKERLAALLTPEFVQAAGLPTDPGEQQDLVRQWHQEKTRRYTEAVRAGAMPPRPGIARIVQEAHDAGWQLAVASTSAEPSVRAVLEHAVGPQRAAWFSVFAGDVVEHKKPAPDIYRLALRELGVDATDAVVVEDSANGLRAALACDLTTVVTVSSYTADEDFTGAALVVSDLGDLPADRTVVLADPLGTPVDGQVTIDTLSTLIHSLPEPRTTMNDEVDPTRADDARLADVIKLIAQTCVDNEKYFCDLDAVAGDGDFGYSLARGFENVLAEFDGYDASDPSALLQKVAMTMSSRIGGTSGPIWGTAFLRGGTAIRGQEQLGSAEVVAMLRAAIEGIKKRGGADVGDKTLLDALVPTTDAIEQDAANGADATTIARHAAQVAREAAEETAKLEARRGRASYTGERSIGSPDPGAVAVAVLAERIADQW